MPKSEMKIIVNNDVHDRIFESSDAVIGAFINADNRLRIAIEQNDTKSIELLGKEVDGMFVSLLDFVPESPSESRKLFRFMIDRFVFGDTGDQIKKRVCERMLDFIR